ncbi:MAG: sodium:solute symporter family protein [Deltaproteobacteria bacterium]|nr:sodium:solute symporter family protein [Deltaproteobacteria bacterium]MBI3079494.1 sodium:solute symporter family protein [Deltaproteobacteria bacterium]
MTLLGILLYVVIQFALGAWISRRVRSESDYFLAGRSLGMGLVTFSLFATWFGAETIIASTGKIYEQGLAGGRADPFGYALCLVLMGVFLAVPLWKRNLTTLGDLYRERYSMGVERLAVVLMIPTSIMWAAAQIRAFGQVLTAASDLSMWVSITVAAVLVIAYTGLGGMLADVLTDLVQGLLMVLGLVVLLLAVLADLGGPVRALSGIAPEKWSFLGERGSLWARLDGWMVPILGSLVAQEVVARVLASRSARVARHASFMAAAGYLIVGLIPVVLGLAATKLYTSVKDSEQLLPMMAATYLSPLLFVLFAGAVVSAILSTVDSALLAASALASHNLLVPALGITSEAQKVRWARIIVVAAGVTAYAMAIYGKGIYELVQAASSFGSAGILVITFAGLYSRFGGPRAATAALVAGTLAMPLGKDALALPAPYLFAVASALGAFVLVEAAPLVLARSGRRPVGAAGG